MPALSALLTAAASVAGPTPGYGFFVCHGRGLSLGDIDLVTAADDARPPLVIEQASGVELEDIDAARKAGVPVAKLRNVEKLRTHRVGGAEDRSDERVSEGLLGS